MEQNAAWQKKIKYENMKDNPGLSKPESLCRMGRSEKMHPAESRVDHLSSPLTYILFDVHSR